MIFGQEPENVTPKARQAAYVVIRDGGSVVAVKSGLKYFLPGGGSEAGESPLETVIREVREELASNILIDREIGEAIQYFYSDDDQIYYKMTATFFAGRLTVSDAAKLTWVSEEVLKGALFHECHRWAMGRATAIETP